MVIKSHIKILSFIHHPNTQVFSYYDHKVKTRNFDNWFDLMTTAVNNWCGMVEKNVREVWLHGRKIIFVTLKVCPGWKFAKFSWDFQLKKVQNRICTPKFAQPSTLDCDTDAMQSEQVRTASQLYKNRKLFACLLVASYLQESMPKRRGRYVNLSYLWVSNWLHVTFGVH